MVRPWIAAALVVPALVACGDRTAAPSEPAATSTTPAAPATWSTRELAGTPAVDFPSVLAADDARGVLALFVSDEGELTSNVSEDGTTWRAGEPTDVGSRYVALGGAVATPSGWFALGSGGYAEVEGDGELLFEALGLESSDGLTWEPVAVSGFDGPVDVSGVVEVDGALVAGGTYRRAADPGSGGFEAAVWTSSDGRAWSEVELPGSRGEESVVSHVAVGAGRVLAAGRVGRRAVLWASDDAGATWQRVSLGGVGSPYDVTGLASVGDVVVLTTSEGGMGRSTDGGLTWSRATTPPPAEEESYPPVWSGGGRFFTVTSVFTDAFSDVATCYADIRLCQQDTVVSFYASDDGDTWTRVDTSGLGGGEVSEVDQATGTAAGAVVVRHSGERGEPLVSSWPAGTPLPTEDEPSPVRAPLVEVPKDGPVEGVRYHAPLYVHCGMDHLYLGDRAYLRTDDGPGVETGAGEEPPADWPVAQQTIFGYATLVSPDVVEYSLESGEVIATYAPTSSGFGCD